MKTRGLDADTHMGLDPLLLAAKATVHDYPGGAEALVKVVGGNPEVLRSQVNPAITSHKLGLVQARQIVLATDDTRIVEQFCRDCHGAYVPLEHYNATGDVGLLQQQLRVEAAHGDFAKQLDQALEDGNISAAELAMLRERGAKIIEAYEGMMARISACQTCD